MEKENEKVFPKGFFKQPRPHATKSNRKDSISFNWSKNILKGKTKAEITFLNK